MTFTNYRWLAIAMTILLLPALARAQGSTSTLSGTVRDEQNLVVPGALITIAGADNALSRTATTRPVPGAAEADTARRAASYSTVTDLARFLG